MDLKEKRKSYVLKSHNKTRLAALIKVGKGKLCCENCGNDVFKLLEINHKNGKGYIERKNTTSKNGWSFYYDIVKGRRIIEDLNVLCKICNVAYHVYLKYGVKYTIFPTRQ